VADAVSVLISAAAAAYDEEDGDNYWFTSQHHTAASAQVVYRAGRAVGAAVAVACSHYLTALIAH